MSECRISVVIPVGRVDRFVGAAITSVLQDLSSEDEVVIVGDGVSIENLMEYSGPSVRLIAHPKRLGTPVALNSGMNVARGNYIARLDADDVSMPGRFDKQVKVFENRPNLVLLGSSAFLMDEDGAHLQMFDRPHGSDYVKQWLLRRNAFVHSSVMMRTSALRGVGGYNEKCLRMQDYELFLRLARVGEIDNLEQPLVQYRIHSKMASRTNSPYEGYTRIVMAERLRLARSIGASITVCLMRNAVWFFAQMARFHGLRRPVGRIDK